MGVPPAGRSALFELRRGLSLLPGVPGVQLPLGAVLLRQGLLLQVAGRARTLAEVQRAVDGMETTRDLDATGDEFQRASQRVRKAIAKLRQAVRENCADTHLPIVRGGDARISEYTLVLRFGDCR